MIFTEQQRSRLSALAERRRHRGGRRKETLADIVGKVQMFGKTQGRVVTSYRGRLKAAGEKESLADEQRKRLGKLQGVMDQLDAAMGELEAASRGIL